MLSSIRFRVPGPTLRLVSAFCVPVLATVLLVSCAPQPAPTTTAPPPTPPVKTSAQPLDPCKNYAPEPGVSVVKVTVWPDPKPSGNPKDDEPRVEPWLACIGREQEIEWTWGPDPAGGPEIEVTFKTKKKGPFAKKFFKGKKPKSGKPEPGTMQDWYYKYDVAVAGYGKVDPAIMIRD